MKDIFKKTSLLHLMVVSGSHLQLLSFFIFWPLPARFRERPIFVGLNWLVLLAYCFITGFQPPVVRAFTARLLGSMAGFWRWHWDSGKAQIATGLFLLVIFPEWISSFSFYLSWLASLGFLLTPLYLKTDPSTFSKIFQTWVTCALIQTFVAVCFVEFSFLGIAMNAVLAPLISISLFPLSILSILIPSSVSLVDSGWNFLLMVLKLLSELAPENNSSFSFQVSTGRWIFLWSFLAFVHCFFQELRQKRFRNSNV